MYFLSNLMEVHLGLPRRLSVKNSLANARDTEYEGLVPGSGRSIGERNRNLSQYSCLENSMERGTWPATVHGVAILSLKMKVQIRMQTQVKLPFFDWGISVTAKSTTTKSSF